MPDTNAVRPLTGQELLQAVTSLGQTWHDAGTVYSKVLAELLRISRPGQISLETGCGRTTLLLSHLSRQHLVFTLPCTEPAKAADHPYDRVRSSDLLNGATTTFILGPTQRTLPAYRFETTFDLILLDGPHAYPFPELEYFHVYPHLRPGGYLIVDDIHIPTIHGLFRFLREDAMYRLKRVIGNTAFFLRTKAPTFPVNGDGWELQRYNARRFPRVTWANWTTLPKHYADRVLPPWAKLFLRKFLLGNR